MTGPARNETGCGCSEGRSVDLLVEVTRARLRELGCEVVVLGPCSMRVGGAQAIVRDTRTGWFMGGDPRRNGYAIGRS